MAAVVDDPLLRTAAVPENSQPQQNLLEELTNSSEDAAIEVVEAAIGEVLQPEEVAADVAPVLLSEAVETTAAIPQEIPVESIDAVAIAEGVKSSPSILETSSNAAEAIQEPINILSSATVDPSLIPLPPLPPINLPTPTVDLPFSEMGLNSWWPTGWVQCWFEMGHASLGLPWWATIMATAVLLRIVTIPLFIYSQKVVAKNTKIMPKFIELQQKYQEASLGGNWQQKMRAQNDLAMFMKSSGYSPLSMVKPTLVQMPIFMSVFLALRGMVNVPVESMKSEGLFWFTNLTIGDPYYLLPLFNSLSIWAQMELGVEMVSASKMDGKQKWIMRAVPVIMFPFLCSKSSALAIYWSSSIWMSFLLKSMLKMEPVRKYFNVPKVDTAAVANKMNPKKEPFSFKGLIKDGKKTYSKYRTNKLATSVEKKDETRWREAGLKGAVKTYKYDPTKVKKVI